MDIREELQLPYQFEIGYSYEARCSDTVYEYLVYAPEDSNITDLIHVDSVVPPWDFGFCFSPKFEPDIEILQIMADADALTTDLLPEWSVIYGEGVKFDCEDSVKERLGIEEPTPEVMKEKGYVLQTRTSSPLGGELVIERVIPRKL
ncbi:hypothetical protein OAG36_00180 [bacterium]|nr:hypothetical protein [bacterium]